MTLPSSGNLSHSEIIDEVFGVGAGSKAFTECVAAANPSVGSIPLNVRAFLGHSQSWGRVYCDNTISYSSYLKRISEGSYYGVLTGLTLLYTADREENVAIYQDTSDTPIPSSEGITLSLYRRLKQTTDSWVLENSWSNYDSFSFGLQSATYDYRIDLS